MLVRRRHRRAAAALGLAGPSPSRIAAEIALAVATFGTLALAAATPVIWDKDSVSSRPDAEAYVFLDTSTSMLARPTVESVDRLDLARASAARLVRGLPADLPVGLAAFNDQPLPLLAPTVDRDAFRETLPLANVSVPTARSFLVAAEQGVLEPIATARASNFATLTVAAASRFFAPRAKHRLLFFVTDDDTAGYDPVGVGRLLRRQGIKVVVLRVGAPSDRLFFRSRDGRVLIDRDYVFDRRHDQLLAATADETGGRFLEGNGAATHAVAFARGELGPAPRETTERLTVRRDPRDLSMVPAVVALAALVGLFLLLGLGSVVVTPPAQDV